MRVGIARSVQHVLEPRPARNTLGIQPVPFYLHHALIEGISLRGGKSADSDCPCERLIEAGASGGKPIYAVEHWIEIELTEIFVLGQIVNKVADVAGVISEVEGQKISIGESESEHAPQLRHENVVAIARIAKMIHPVKIVVH